MPKRKCPYHMTSCFKECDRRCEETKEMVRIRSVGIKIRKLKSSKEKRSQGEYKKLIETYRAVRCDYVDFFRDYCRMRY